MEWLTDTLGADFKLASLLHAGRIFNPDRRYRSRVQKLFLPLEFQSFDKYIICHIQIRFIYKYGSS